MLARDVPTVTWNPHLSVLLCLESELITSHVSQLYTKVGKLTGHWQVLTYFLVSFLRPFSSALTGTPPPPPPHTNTHTLTTRTNTHTHTHARTPTRAYTHTHTHKHTHTRTHTNTHTRARSVWTHLTIVDVLFGIKQYGYRQVKTKRINCMILIANICVSIYKKKQVISAIVHHFIWKSAKGSLCLDVMKLAENV